MPHEVRIYVAERIAKKDVALMNVDRNLTEEVKAYAEQLGADLVGIASSDRFTPPYPEGHRPQDIIPNAKSAVVFIIRNLCAGLTCNWEKMMKDTRMIPKPAQKMARNSLYQASGYVTLIQELMHIGHRLAIYLTDKGYDSFNIPPSYDDWKAIWHGQVDLTCGGIYPAGEAWHPFPHAIAGFLAGLGDLGKSHLLLTPQFGPRHRIASVVTVAPLEPDPVIEKRLCPDSCIICIEKCPTNALRNELYEVSYNGRTMKFARYDKSRCLKLGMENPGCGGQCGIVCPVKKKY